MVKRGENRRAEIWGYFSFFCFFVFFFPSQITLGINSQASV